MSEYLESLIFDRTQEDIDLLTEKSYIDYNDLNRVEKAIKWISYILNRYGYKNKISFKVWLPEDLRTEEDMERIRNNIETLRTAYFAPESTPLTPEKITYLSIWQANAIEKILFDIGSLVESVYPGLRHLSFKLSQPVIGNREVNY